MVGSNSQVETYWRASTHCCRICGKFIHFTYLQFTRLCETIWRWGGYVCTISLRALITAWLKVSQISWDCERLNISAGSKWKWKLGYEHALSTNWLSTALMLRTMSHLRIHVHKALIFAFYRNGMMTLIIATLFTIPSRICVVSGTWWYLHRCYGNISLYHSVLASKLSTRMSFVVSMNSCSTHVIKAMTYCAQHLNDFNRNVKILLEFFIRHSQVSL